MTMLPISMTLTALQSMAALPDCPQHRFIGSALEAARLAMQMDVPRHELGPLLNARLEMIVRAFYEWSETENL